MYLRMMAAFGEKRRRGAALQSRCAAHCNAPEALWSAAASRRFQSELV
jgi:hypothetical protein